MARKDQITGRELARSLLLARCELDRRELSESVHSTRDQFRHRVHVAGRAAPWLLIGVPVGALLIGRAFKVRKLASLLVIARVASQLRPFLPVVAGLLRRSNRR